MQHKTNPLVQDLLTATMTYLNQNGKSLGKGLSPSENDKIVFEEKVATTVLDKLTKFAHPETGTHRAVDFYNYLIDLNKKNKTTQGVCEDVLAYMNKNFSSSKELRMEVYEKMYKHLGMEKEWAAAKIQAEDREGAKYLWIESAISEKLRESQSVKSGPRAPRGM